MSAALWFCAGGVASHVLAIAVAIGFEAAGEDIRYRKWNFCLITGMAFCLACCLVQFFWGPSA